ncbi:MAG TPA: HAMP domain-containing sensor histidine kinase [Candidatus Limnocylindria bacterium]
MSGPPEQALAGGPAARRLDLRAYTLGVLLAGSVAVAGFMVDLSSAAWLLLALLATVISTAFEGRRSGGVALAIGMAFTLDRAPIIDVATYGAIGVACIAAVSSLREERQRSEFVREEVAHARQWIQQLVDVLPQGVVVRDRGGRLVLFNEEAVRLLGAPVPLSLRESVRSFEPREPDGAPRASETFRFSRALAGETVNGDELVVRDIAHAIDRTLVSSVAPVRVGSEIVAAVATFTDISEMRDLERERIQFFSMLGHELKSPLTAISAQGELLARLIAKGAPPDRLRSTLDRLEQPLRRMTGLADEMSDLAALTSGQFQVHAERVDLRPILAGAVARAAAASDRHELRLDMPGEVQLMADEFRLGQVLDNLLGNAVHYSPDGGTVRVRVTVEGPDGVIRVIDQGIGVPEGERDRLFQPFFRASNAHIRRGTGLGLYISRDIARRLDGNLVLEASGPSGSTFTLALPLAARVERT